MVGCQRAAFIAVEAASAEELAQFGELSPGEVAVRLKLAGAVAMIRRALRLRIAPAPLPVPLASHLRISARPLPSQLAKPLGITAGIPFPNTIWVSSPIGSRLRTPFLGMLNVGAPLHFLLPLRILGPQGADPFAPLLGVLGILCASPRLIFATLGSKRIAVLLAIATLAFELCGCVGRLHHPPVTVFMKSWQAMNCSINMPSMSPRLTWHQ